jgi:octaprenyl-diphosphate synthase
MAFQIKDDLFDYGETKIGKPTGNDIREKKLTLPLIYTINHVDKTLRNRLIYILKNKNKEKSQVNFVIDTVKKVGGLDYAHKKMLEFQKDANRILHEFPENKVRTELESLVNYTIERKY